MTTREKALLASSPSLVVLIGSLAWLVIDRKGDTRQHLIDRTVRLLERASAAAARL